MLSRMSVASRVSISPSIKSLDLNRFKNQLNSSNNKDEGSAKQPLFMPAIQSAIKEVIPEVSEDYESGAQFKERLSGTLNENL